MPAMAAVTTKMPMVSTSNLPTRFVSAMLAMELEIEKKISGTSKTNSRFSQIWPMGYRTEAFSPKVRPRIAPTMTNAMRISGSR